MEKERRKKALSLVALIVAVMGLTIAFAAMSKTLTINGSANVDSAKWNVHFESLDGNSTVSCKITNAYASDTVCLSAKLSNDKTKLDHILLSFNFPGESAKYDLKIVNEGSIDAKIGSISKNTPRFGKSLDCMNKDEIENEEDCVFDIDEDEGNTTEKNIQWYKDYFTYKLVYTDTQKEVLVGDVIKAGEEVNVSVVLEVSNEATSLPEYEENYDSGLAVADAQISVLYVQD